MLHHLRLRVHQGILAEATVRQGTSARAQGGQEASGRPACTTRHFVPVCSERYLVQGLQGQKRTSGDAIVQGFSTHSWCTRWGTWPVYSNADWKSWESGWSIRGGALARGSALEDPRIPSNIFFLEQRPDPSSCRQASRHAAPTKLPPSFARHVSHLGRAPPNFASLSASLPHVPSSGYPRPASWADLVRIDPLKAQDSHSLEMSSRIGGRRSRSTIGGGGGDVTDLSPFWEETARKQPLPGTYLTNPLVKYDEFGAGLPTM